MLPRLALITRGTTIVRVAAPPVTDPPAVAVVVEPTATVNVPDSVADLPEFDTAIKVQI